MARPREQAGGLAEASRLLQEGLQLLAEREREVDRLLEGARERALLIREEAEQRAAQITADAEQRRLEAEELVAGLRSEVEALRAELARLRSGAEPTPGPTSNNSEVGITGSAGVVESVQDPEPAVAPVASHEREHLDGPQSSESGEIIDAPRWGRPSSTVGGQQAVRAAKSSKPRWLPPWLPFTLTLVLAAALVGMNVSGQAALGGSRVRSAVILLTPMHRPWRRRRNRAARVKVSGGWNSAQGHTGDRGRSQRELSNASMNSVT